MYGMSFESLLVLLPIKLLVVTINAAICFILIVFLPRVLPKDKFTFGKRESVKQEENAVEKDVNTEKNNKV